MPWNEASSLSYAHNARYSACRYRGPHPSRCRFDEASPHPDAERQEHALLRVEDDLVDCNHLAWASRVADGLPAQTVSAHRTLNMLVGDETDGIDVEAEICHLMGFDPSTYTLAEELTTDSEERESVESRF